MRQSTISCSALLLVLLSLVAPSACLRRPSITTTTAAATTTTLSRSISIDQGRRDLAFSTESIALLMIRGGAEEVQDSDSDSDSDDDDEEEENAEENEAAASDDEASDEESEEVEEVAVEAQSEESEDEYDEEYDVEEEEEKDATLVASIKTKSQDFVEPYFQSPMTQLYTTLGAMMLAKRVDLFSPTIVLLLRFAFIAQLVLQQLFIIYVRIAAKSNDDRTAIELSNPLSNVLKSQLENNEAMANGMVKDLASSFLKSESTVMEYDRKQAASMQGGMIFNMAFMWLLHFKMGQVQPLFIQTCSGLLNLVYSPLFQVYVLGRNLERPFKSKSPFDPNMGAAPATDEVAKGVSDESDKEETNVKKASAVKSTNDDEDAEEDDASDNEEDGEDSDEEDDE